MKTVNLYREDGIAIYVNDETDICSKDEATVKVIGHPAYVGSVEEAEQSIRRAYLAQAGIADPLEA